VLFLPGSLIIAGLKSRFGLMAYVLPVSFIIAGAKSPYSSVFIRIQIIESDYPFTTATNFWYYFRFTVFKL
jgi:hypothetical protein